MYEVMVEGEGVFIKVIVEVSVMVEVRVCIK